jgi:hypothetical protein
MPRVVKFPPLPPPAMARWCPPLGSLPSEDAMKKVEPEPGRWQTVAQGRSLPQPWEKPARGARPWSGLSGNGFAGGGKPKRQQKDCAAREGRCAGEMRNCAVDRWDATAFPVPPGRRPLGSWGKAGKASLPCQTVTERHAVFHRTVPGGRDEARASVPAVAADFAPCVRRRIGGVFPLSPVPREAVSAMTGLAGGIACSGGTTGGCFPVGRTSGGGGSPFANRGGSGTSG